MSSETDPLVSKPEGDEAKGRTWCGGGWFFKEPCCEGEGATVSSGKQRDAHWDNWKGWAVCMVFCAHCSMLPQFLATKDGVSWDFQNAIQGRLCHGLWNFICLHVIPSFCFISGYFSTATPGRKQIANQIRFCIAWFFARGIWFLILGQLISKDYKQVELTFHAHHPDLERTNAQLEADGHSPLTPPGFWPLRWFTAVLGADWYLWCVIVWRLFLPLIGALHRPLLVSICLSCFFLMTDVTYSPYTCAPFGYLPFFVGGFVFKGIVKEHKAQVQAWKENTTAKAVYGVAFLAVMMASQYTLEASVHLRHAILCLYGGPVNPFFSDQFHDLYEANFTHELKDPQLSPPVNTFCHTPSGIAHMITYWVLAYIMIFLAMAAVPSRELPILTRAGVNSLYIYLAHVWLAWLPMFVVFTEMMVAGMAVGHTTALLIVIPLTLLLFVCHTYQWLKCMCQPFIEPDVETCCLARTKDEV